jgi:hypothetical protein
MNESPVGGHTKGVVHGNSLIAFWHFALRLRSALQLGTLSYAKKQNAPQQG